MQNGFKFLPDASYVDSSEARSAGVQIHSRGSTKESPSVTSLWRKDHEISNSSLGGISHNSIELTLSANPLQQNFQWVACLLYKHKDLSLSPQDPQNVDVRHLSVTLVLGRQTNPRGLLGSPCS